MRDAPRTRRRAIATFVVALVLAGLSVPLAAVPVLAAYSSSTTTGSSSLSAKRIFTGTRTVVPHNLHDASNGTDTDSSDPTYSSDTLKLVTGNWSNNFATTRYLEFDLDGPNPAGLATTAVTFDFSYADSKNAAGDNACYYFEVRRISTGALLNTYGSSAAPVSCATTNTFVTDHTSILADVPSTDVANDLRIRVYMYESAKSASWVDLATLTVTTANATRTEYAERFIDQSTGAANDVSWDVAYADSLSFQSKSNWPSAYASTKYVTYTFPTSVPSGSTLNSVTLNHSYRPQAAATLCYYFEVYSGTTLLAAHGSTTADVSCNATTTYVTDAVSLPEVNTVALANSVTVKMYFKVSPGKPSQQDVVTLGINYSLT
jgi:hypothetical protein